MKILVTGGTGQISGQLVAQLVRRGHVVTRINRGLLHQHLDVSCTSVIGDLAFPRPYDAIGGESFDTVIQFQAFNAHDVARDIDFFRDSCGHYFLISSAAVYDKPFPSTSITESCSAKEAGWAYRDGKMEAERVLVDSAPFPWTVIRPSHTLAWKVPSVLGDGDRMLRRILRNEPVFVLDEGQTMWTITDAEDVAYYIAELIECDAAVGEVFNIAPGDCVSWRYIVELLADALDCDVDIRGVNALDVVRLAPALAGPILLEKSWSHRFDSSKLFAAVGQTRQVRGASELLRAVVHSAIERIPQLESDDAHDRLMAQLIEVSKPQRLV